MVDKVTAADIQNLVTDGAAASRLINDEKRAINQLIDRDNTFGTAVTVNTGTQDADVPLNSQLEAVLDSKEARLKPIDTIVDLRAYEPAYDGQQILLLGHTTPGQGGGVFYADFSDTTSVDNNGTIIVTPNGRRWKRKLAGYVTPEMFGANPDGTGNQQPALQAASDTGLTVQGTGRESVYRITSDWLPMAVDGRGCTFKTVNCSIRFQKATGDNQNTEARDFQIDDTETTLTGDGAMVVEKGDMWRFNLIDARGNSANAPNRRGLVLRPFEDFAWIENAHFGQVKFSNFGYPRYVEVPNFNGVFINQITFVNSEIRDSGINAMYIDTSATTATGQKVGNWTFICDEFDGGGQTGDNLIFCKTAGGVAEIEAFTFINTALEDTATLHTGAVIDGDDMTKFTNPVFISAIRFNFPRMLPASYTRTLFNTLDSTLPNCQDFDLNNVRVNDADIDNASISGINNLYTGATGGTSSFNPGETRTALVLPVVDNYRDYELIVHPAAASGNSAAQIVRVICGPGGATVHNLISGSDMAGSVSGLNLQLTNGSASARQVRYSWRFLRSSE